MPSCTIALCRIRSWATLLVVGMAAVAVVVPSRVAAQDGGANFPQTHSDIAPDPSVLYGQLDNGFRYGLLVNQQPRDKVSLRLLVESGSLLETDEQRGLAHFLEHMAFNGTTHYPHGSLVTVLQSLGLAFGADTNAHTGFDETVYKLDLPDAKDATIATGLQVFADYAGGMLIQQQEVDRERGVILAEMRDSNSPNYREWLAIYHAIYPGLNIADRFPIGTKPTVEHADSALLQDYYGHWYRPERMMLCVAGAIEPQAVAKQITALFKTLEARDPARPPQSAGTLQADGFNASYHRESEATGTTVVLCLVKAQPRPHDSIALQRSYLLDGISDGVLNRRFRDIIAQHPEGALLTASSESYQWMDLWHAQIRATVRPGMAIAAVAVLEQKELRRLHQFGPTGAELSVVIEEQKAGLDQSVAQAGTRTNADLATVMYSQVHQDSVMQSPAQARDLFKPMLEQVTPVQVQQAGQVAWAQGHIALVVTGADDLGADAATQLEAAYTASQLKPVEPPVQRKALPWGYARVPEPGHWHVEPSQSKTLDFWAGEFDNGVAVRVKRTDFQPNEVLVQVRIDIPPTMQQAGVREFAQRAFIAGGLGKHSATELSDVLADSTVSVQRLAFDETGVSLIASCQPKELELCCQELRAYLTDPGWRSDGEATAKAMWKEGLASIRTNLNEQVSRTFEDFAVAGDPARRPATLAEAELVNFSSVRLWLTPILHDNPMTVTVVGDVQATVAMDQLTTYFGSLPEHKHVVPIPLPEVANALMVCPPLPSGEHALVVPGTVARALIEVAWPTSDYYDISRTRRLGVLASVLTERMRVRIRQELGDAYSPYARRFASEGYRDFGYLLAQVGVAPGKAAEGKATLLNIAQELVDHGVPDELFNRVKTPIIKSLATQVQQNQYWLYSVLGRSASQPFRLAWAESLVSDYNSMTAEQISALAKQYLINAKTLQVVGVCNGPETK